MTGSIPGTVFKAGKNRPFLLLILLILILIMLLFIYGMCRYLLGLIMASPKSVVLSAEEIQLLVSSIAARGAIVTRQLNQEQDSTVRSVRAKQIAELKALSLKLEA